MAAGDLVPHQRWPGVHRVRPDAAEEQVERSDLLRFTVLLDCRPHTALGYDAKPVWRLWTHISAMAKIFQVSEDAHRVFGRSTGVSINPIWPLQVLLGGLTHAGSDLNSPWRGPGLLPRAIAALCCSKKADGRGLWAV